jgi:hypothetical protein
MISTSAYSKVKRCFMPTGTPRQPWQDRLHETASRVEEDLRALATYINDEVVPDVRRHSSTALRTAATELQKLAQRLDEDRHSGSPPPDAPKV